MSHEQIDTAIACGLGLLIVAVSAFMIGFI